MHPSVHTWSSSSLHSRPSKSIPLISSHPSSLDWYRSSVSEDLLLVGKWFGWCERANALLIISFSERQLLQFWAIWHLSVVNCHFLKRYFTWHIIVKEGLRMMTHGKKCSRYLLTTVLMENQVRFCCPKNIFLTWNPPVVQLLVQTDAIPLMFQFKHWVSPTEGVVLLPRISSEVKISDCKLLCSSQSELLMSSGNRADTSASSVWAQLNVRPQSACLKLYK